MDPTKEEIEAAATKTATENEAKRQSEIRSSFASFQFEGSADLLNACLTDITCSAEDAGKKLLAKLGKDQTPASGPGIVVEDARDKFKAGVEKAVEMKIGREKADYSNEFLSMSLLDYCKQDAANRSVSTTGLNKFDIVATAMQPGSDFPGILENVATKEVLRGYDETEEVYTQLARVGSLPDFKAASRTGLGHAPSLQLNREKQEVESIEVGDRKQSIQLATYAGKGGLSRQAIINDDLGEFGRLMGRYGRGARRTVGDQFASVFTTNADGASIDEGSARIFASARSNTGTAGVPTTASFTELRKLMMLQSDVSENATSLNIPPRFIYCPVALEGSCQVVAQSEKEVVAAKTATTPNVERGRWEIITDARLDSSGLAKAATRYYALADPNQFDTVEVAFLDGQDEPQIQRVDVYDPLGVTWVVWIDCVAQALDFRGMALNDGS